MNKPPEPRNPEWLRQTPEEDAAARRYFSQLTQTQSCARGEHMYVTGRRTCPLCGEEL